MLSYIIGFLAVAVFPTALALFGGHLATLAIADFHKRRLAIGAVWGLAILGIVFAGLQQIGSYRSDQEHDAKVSELQRTANGLQGTVNTSLQRQEYMRGQLESIGLMIGKVGEKSTDPVLGQLAGAIAKMADNARSTNTAASSAKDVHLTLLYRGVPLNGQTIAGGDQPGQLKTPEVQIKNEGTQATGPFSARLYLSAQIAPFMSFWQSFDSDEPGFPGAIFFGGPIPISPQETWSLPSNVLQLMSDTKEPVTAKLKIFYSAAKPAEAAFTIRRSQI